VMATTIENANKRGRALPRKRFVPILGLLRDAGPGAEAMPV
jgi:hypothetical protein